jgi:glycogen(starch) synthase
MTPRRDVIYCEGPGDIVASYASWRRGKDYLDETSVTFSGQFFEFCRLEKLSFYAVSRFAKPGSFTDETGTVANMPRWIIRIPKIGYEITVAIHALRLLMVALRVRPKLIFVGSGIPDGTYLWLLRLSGAKVVPVLHNTLWPEGFRPTGMGSRLRQLIYRVVWRRCFWNTLAVSSTCSRQVKAIAGNVPVVAFKPSFPDSSFHSIPEPKEHGQLPFRVMYAGRIEENKGVFDILSIAERLSRGKFEFTLCGDGNGLAPIRREIAKRGLNGVVKTFGRVDRQELLARYLDAHIVIVPTRSAFEEGFAMVVAEAILLLRPVVTNPVVPAAEMLPDAVMMARTDDVQSYADQIAKIQSDRAGYMHLVDKARQLRPFIMEDSSTFLAALRTVWRGADLVRRAPGRGGQQALH